MFNGRYQEIRLIFVVRAVEIIGNWLKSELGDVLKMFMHEVT